LLDLAADQSANANPRVFNRNSNNNNNNNDNDNRSLYRGYYFDQSQSQLSHSHMPRVAMISNV
jgi:hypothetical protein